MPTFKEDILEGLDKTPKKLPSRYFYDDIGDALFQRIMKLEEYYLPRKEMEIIRSQSDMLARRLQTYHRAWEIVELGAGDGAKTVHLLQALVDHDLDITYRPLDISAHILEENRRMVQGQVPCLKIEPMAGNYFHTYPTLPKKAAGRLVLFLGSNIGNFTLSDAQSFIQLIRTTLSPNDFLLIAFDLVKDPRQILAAYDDREGVTAAFNLNLLTRINRELGANFIVDQFMHYATYHPDTGYTHSYLISTCHQEVLFPDGTSYTFDQWEPIHMEISKKYFLHEIEQLAKNSALHVDDIYRDQEGGYACVLMRYAT
jgi:L-histidine N-alpha-methyltransferase